MSNVNHPSHYGHALAELWVVLAKALDASLLPEGAARVVSYKKCKFSARDKS